MSHPSHNRLRRSDFARQGRGVLTQGWNGFSARGRAADQLAQTRERGASGGERRASTAAGAGQLQQLQAAVERRAEEETSGAQEPAHAHGQAERRSARSRRRHAAPGRRAGRDR